MYGDQQVNLSVVAAADLPERYLIVQGSGTSGKNAVAGLATAKTQSLIGVAQNQPLAGEHMTVCPFGLTRVKAGGSITAYGRITSDGSGRAVATGSGDVCIGYVLEGAASGDLVTAFLNADLGRTIG
jgi:hypothetical protein